MNWDRALKMKSFKFDFHNKEVFVVGRTIYSIDQGNLSVTRYKHIHSERAMKVKYDLSVTRLNRKLYSLTLALQLFKVYITGGKEGNDVTGWCLYFDLITE